MLPFFDCRENAHGIIAVGGQATGVFAFGQMATGVIAVGQLARGVVAVGQLAFGVVTIGQLSGGLVRTWGMLAVGAKASGLLGLSILPRPPERKETPTVPVASVISGSLAEGSVRLTVAPDGRGGFVWMEGGVTVDTEINAPAVHPLLHHLHKPLDVLARVVGEETFDDQSVVGWRTAAPSRHRLRVKELQVVDAQPSVSVVSWIFRALAGIVLAVAVGQFALRPVIELFLGG